MGTNDEWRGLLSRLLEEWQLDAGEERARQIELLEALHRHVDAWPWPFLHASWLAECLPEDRRLRGWCIALLPERVAVEIAEQGAGNDFAGEHDSVFLEPLPPPPWLAPWWRHELITRLGYPLPLPESTDRVRPLSFLWCFSPRDVLTVLERFGWRCLAAHVSSMPRRRAAELVLALSPADRAGVVERVREGAFPPEVAEAGFRPSAEDLRVLGLETIAHYALVTSCTSAVRRVAFRLPRQFGRHALPILDDELTAPPAIEHWTLEEWLRLDVRELLAEGLVTLPIPGEAA